LGKHPIIAAAVTYTIAGVAAITVDVALHLLPPLSPEHAIEVVIACQRVAHYMLRTVSLPMFQAPPKKQTSYGPLQQMNSEAKEDNLPHWHKQDDSCCCVVCSSKQGMSARLQATKIHRIHL